MWPVYPRVFYTRINIGQSWRKCAKICIIFAKVNTFARTNMRFLIYSSCASQQIPFHSSFGYEVPCQSKPTAIYDMVKMIFPCLSILMNSSR